MKHSTVWVAGTLLLSLAAAAPAQQASPSIQLSALDGSSLSMPEGNILRTCGIQVSMGSGLSAPYDVYWTFNPVTIQFVPYAVGPASPECETRSIPTPPVFDECDLDGDLNVDGYEAAYCYQQGQNQGPDECDMNGDGSVTAEEESNCMGPPDAEECDLNGDGLVELDEENQCMGVDDGYPDDGGPHYGPDGDDYIPDPACDTNHDGVMSDEELMACGPADGADDGNDVGDQCGPDGCAPPPGDDPVACDMDGDGVVSAQEASQCDVPPAQCDANSDGVVTVSEAESCAPVDPCDTDGDGSISEEEALACPADDGSSGDDEGADPGSEEPEVT